MSLPVEVAQPRTVVLSQAQADRLHHLVVLGQDPVNHIFLLGGRPANHFTYWADAQ